MNFAFSRPRASRLSRLLILLLAVGLGGSVEAADKASETAVAPLAQYVLMAHSPMAGKTVPLARAILPQGSRCPAVTFGDGSASLAMQPRENPNPAVFGVVVCEAVLSGVGSRPSLAGKALPLPPADGTLDRVVVVGDSGCKGGSKQDCSSSWPFPEIATAAAKGNPQLVIHVGDYNYRGTPNKTEEGSYSYDGCIPLPVPGEGPATLVQQSSYSTWSTWEEDFFAAAAPLLKAAPWVVARGNHELCSRGGQGWFYFLDPHSPLLDPYRPQPGCETPTVLTSPYRLSFANLDLLMLDTANACGTGEGTVGPRGEAYEIDTYALQLASFEQLLQGATNPVWVVGHRPIWSIEDFSSDAGGTGTLDCGSLDVDNPTLQKALAATARGALPPAVALVLSGHMHQFFSMTFDGPRPPQLVIGNSGVALDGDLLPSPYQGCKVDGLEARGLSVAAGPTYGYLEVTMQDGAHWQGVIPAFDAAGAVQAAPVATCSLPVAGGMLCHPGG